MYTISVRHQLLAVDRAGYGVSISTNISAYSNATAYTENVMDIKNINVSMTYNAVHACDTLCKNMAFFVLQTGTNVCYTLQISSQQ